MGEAGQPLPPCPHCRATHPEEVLACPNTNRLLPLAGRVLDNRFRFIEKLGEGGMSTVWMAENFRVRKRVAIKLMHPEMARNPRTLHRFQNEATAAGRIGNPHICDILDLGESMLGPYIVMEMLSGQSFAELLETQGRIDPPLAVLIIREALKGLIAAHRAGIIHRDLKPENVFLHEPEPGRMLVKLMDFGISKFTEDPGGGRTGANVVMGTPEYMSPEQAAGAANVDARTDIWAMGVMLYRAVAGVEPFRGKTMAALLLALSTEDHAPLDSFVPNLNPGLIAVVDRCLAKDAQYRFQTAQELYDILAPYQQIVAEGERPVAPVRTGRTMAVGLAGPAVEAVRTGAARDRESPTTRAPTTPGLAPRDSGSAGTWSSELAPPPGADQSWSMGRATFNEDESRPYTPTKERSDGKGWIIILGLVLLVLGGGGVAAWLTGLLDPYLGAGATLEANGESGVVAEAEVETGETPEDLPVDVAGTETGAGETSEADGTGGTEAGAGESGAAEAGEDTSENASGSNDDGDSSDDGGSSDSGGTNGTPKVDYSSLIRQGNLYTHKSRGPNGTWQDAQKYCRRAKTRRRHGLSKWRMATIDELGKFRSTEVDRLLYWSSEKSDGKAKVMTMMNGRITERATSDPAPRAFCVSRK